MPNVFCILLRKFCSIGGAIKLAGTFGFGGQSTATGTFLGVDVHVLSTKLSNVIIKISSFFLVLIDHS